MFKKDERGFTLIELLIVIVIIGILAGVLVTVLNPAQQQLKARQAVLRSNVEKMCMALHSCGATTGNATNCDTMAELGIRDPYGSPAAAGGTTDGLYVIDGDNDGSHSEYVGVPPAHSGTPATIDTATVWASGIYGTCTFECGYDFNLDQPMIPTNIMQIQAGAAGCLIGVQ